ncbi:MAG: TadE family protein [Duganella sp.]
MPPPRRAPCRPRQPAAPCRPAGGVAVMEMLIVMMFLLTVLIVPLYLGRYFYHYTMAQKAVQNAVTYLARVPVAEIVNPQRAAIVAGVANQMVAEMLAEVAGSDVPPTVIVQCGQFFCSGLERPATVTVGVMLPVDDIFFPTYLSSNVTVYIQLPYLGR